MAKLLDPTGASLGSMSGVPTAPRLRELRGIRVGLLDNSKTNANRLLEALAQLLQDEFGPLEFIRGAKERFGLPAPDDLLDEMAEQCDTILEAVGD